MQEAIDRYLKDGLSVRAAAKEHNMSHKTLGKVCISGYSFISLVVCEFWIKFKHYL